MAALGNQVFDRSPGCDTAFFRQYHSVTWTTATLTALHINQFNCDNLIQTFCIGSDRITFSSRWKSILISSHSHNTTVHYINLTHHRIENPNLPKIFVYNLINLKENQSRISESHLISSGCFGSYSLENLILHFTFDFVSLDKTCIIMYAPMGA